MEKKPQWLKSYEWYINTICSYSQYHCGIFCLPFLVFLTLLPSFISFSIPSFFPIHVPLAFPWKGLLIVVISMYLFYYVPGWVYVHHVHSRAWRDLRESDLLELELKAVVNLLIQMPGSKPQSSARVESF